MEGLITRPRFLRRRYGRKHSGYKWFQSGGYAMISLWSRQSRDLCYKCMDRHRIVINCRKTVECSICHRSHHTAMHISRKGKFNDKRDRDVRQNNGRPRQDRNSRPPADRTWPEKQKGLLRLAPIEVLGSNASVNTFALLDGGSTISLIDKRFTRKLGINREQIRTSVKGLWGEAVGVKCERVSFEVIAAHGTCKVEHALSVNNLDLPSQSLFDRITERIKNLENVRIESYVNVRRIIPLGQDNWDHKIFQFSYYLVW